MSERHAILGAGGIGGLMGVLLAAGGDRVTLVVREGTVDAYPPELTLRRHDGSVVTGAARVVSSLPPGDDVDVLWVTTKALHLNAALRSVSAARPHCVVPLLNGLDHLAKLEQTFGPEVVIPGTIGVEAERLAPGIIRQGTPFAFLRLAERGRALLAKSAALLVPLGMNVEFVADETTLMWSKLVLLAPFALATTASGEPLGFIRENPDWLALMTGAVDEVAAVGRAEGAAFDTDYVARTLAPMMNAPPKTSSSMARDVAAGNEPELDAIAGVVVRAAERQSIPVPVLRELMQRVRDRVSG
jgi:2-dehydropantoate 2-reductase